jgi:hypothetical protein
MAQPVARRQALDQSEDAGGDVLRKHAAGEPQRAVHPVAQGEYVRRRGRLVNGKVEGREDRARLLERYGAAPVVLQQGRSVEARQHDAEAPLKGHLAEHLRRRAAGGEDSAGHSRLPPAYPPRHAGLEQLHDLTGRPAVDVREEAFADLLPQRPPHRPSSCRGKQTPAARKKEPPVVAAAGCRAAHLCEEEQKFAASCQSGAIDPEQACGLSKAMALAHTGICQGHGGALLFRVSAALIHCRRAFVIDYPHFQRTLRGFVQSSIAAVSGRES